MAGLDTALGKVVRTVLNQFGRDATLRLKGEGGTYDTETGTVEEDDPVEVAVKIRDVVYKARAERPQEGGDSPSEGRDEAMLLAAIDLPRDPTTGDELVDGDLVLQIIDVHPTRAIESVVMFELHVRR